MIRRLSVSLYININVYLSFIFSFPVWDGFECVFLKIFLGFVIWTSAFVSKDETPKHLRNHFGQLFFRIKGTGHFFETLSDVILGMISARHTNKVLKKWPVPLSINKQFVNQSSERIGWVLKDLTVEKLNFDVWI